MGFVPGPFELVIIAAVVLLLFGKRLPSAARSIGQSIKEFRTGLQDVQSDIDGAVAKR